MFRGIFLVVSIGTLVFNRRAVLLTILFGGIITFFCYGFETTISRYTRRRVLYFAGVVFGLTALGIQQSNTWIATVPLSGSVIVDGQVVDQIKSDTYLFLMSGQQYVLQTTIFLGPGTLVRGTGRFTPQHTPSLSWSHWETPVLFQDTFAFDRRLSMKKYVGRITADPSQLHKVGSQDLSRLYALRQEIKAKLKTLFPHPKLQALLLGFTTGDRSGFTRDEYDSFIESGLVHLLAVSGSNIVYVALFCSLLLFFLPVYLRMIAVGIIIIFYGLLCGADSSVMRAVIMGVLSLGTTLSGKIVETGRLVRLAAGAMLLWNPLLLRYDLGFLLSFGAVIGILFLTQRRHTSRENKESTARSRAVSTYLFPTLGASLGVYPILILFTGTISLSSVVTNLIVVPLVPLFLLLALVAGTTGRLRLYFILQSAANELFQLTYFSATHGLFLSVGNTFSKLAVSLLFFALLRYISSSYNKKSAQ